MTPSPQHPAWKLSHSRSLLLADCEKTTLARENFDGRRCGLTEEHPRRILKKARLLTRPTPATISPSRPESAKTDSLPCDAPCPKQGHSSTADPRFTFHASRFTVPLISILLVLLCLAGTACSTTAQTGKIIFDDPRGTVSLQTISDRSIQANHPINLEPALLTQLLKGIEILDQDLGHNHVTGFQSMVIGAYPSVPVFSEDQVSFLAPLLAEGLRAAAPDQRVEYRVRATYKRSSLESSTTETTAGSLYAYGRQLYVTLSQYRYNQMMTNMNLRDSFGRENTVDYSNLRDRILVFTPKAAQRIDSYDQPTRGKSTDKFLAVDYELLQQASQAIATTGQTAPQMERTAPVRESPAGTSASEAPSHTTEALAQEVETLRKQLESVQKRLDSQSTGQDSPKQKTTPQQK